MIEDPWKKNHSEKTQDSPEQAKSVDSRKDFQNVTDNYQKLEVLLGYDSEDVGIEDEDLKKSFAQDLELLKKEAAQKVQEFKENFFSSFSRQDQTDDSEYMKLLESKKEAVLQNRIFYRGQSLDNNNKDLWTNELQSHPDMFGKRGMLGDYLNKIASLDPESSLCILAKKLYEVGDVNDLPLYTNDGPSGYSGGFINISSKAFIISETEPKSKEKWLKAYIDMVGPERYFVQTCLHESIHALTLKTINAPKTPEQRVIADKLFTVFNEVKRAVPEEKLGQYGFTDLDEFLAEFLTSGSFRETVSGIILENKSLNEGYFNNVLIEDYVRIKIRDLVEAVTRKESPSSGQTITGQSDILIRDLIAQLVGGDIYVEGLEDGLETAEAQRLAKHLSK